MAITVVHSAWCALSFFLSTHPTTSLPTYLPTVQVVNFYELRELVHVKTVPIMEELEGLVILNAHHSRALLGAAAHDSEAKMAKRKSRNTSSSSSKEGGSINNSHR